MIKFIIQSIIAGLAIGFLIVFFKPELINQSTSQSLNQTAAMPLSYAPAINKVAQSVVSIYAQAEVVRRRHLSPEEQKLTGLSSLVSRPFTQQYLGSGVVMTSDGYIVTNFHVINNATQIIVSLWDGSLLEAKLIGTDSVTDIAVLKIEALNLKPAVFADSDRTQIGDIAMAIGNPYGLSQSVSLGIISAKGRSGLDVSTIENFIQTDAAINEGNSGGALINTNGEVVGISTATFNKNGAQGINFAIPSNATKLIMNEILKYGKVLRGSLGIGLFSPKQLYSERIIKPRIGVLVAYARPHYPAAQAGIQKYDIITHVDEIQIKDQRHFREIIAKSKPGEKLILRGYSQGVLFSKEIKTVDRPSTIQ